MTGCPAIEWALAHGDRDAAALLIRRHLAGPRPGSQASQMQTGAFRKGWQLAPRRDGLPSLPEFSPPGLSWLARVHHLPAPDALHDPPPLSRT